MMKASCPTLMIKITTSIALTLSKKISYSRTTSCVFPRGQSESFESKRCMEEAWLATFGINKTIDMLKEHFFLPKMGGDVHAVIFKCSICLKAKSQFHQGLYTPLPISNGP